MTVTYFITGGNRGIGFALAKELSTDSNNTVIVTSRTLKNAADLQALNKSNIHIIELEQTDDLNKIKKDLTKIDQISPAGVDVVIHNAAISEDNLVPIIDLSVEHFNRHFDINILGPIKVHQAIYPYWIKKNSEVAHKKIVFISSLAASLNNFLNTSFGGYGISKAGINYVNRTLASEHEASDNEVVRSSVTIAVNPGLVRTRMSESFRSNPDSAKANLDVLEPQDSARAILSIVDSVKPEDSGKFYDTNGESIEY